MKRAKRVKRESDRSPFYVGAGSKLVRTTKIHNLGCFTIFNTPGYSCSYWALISPCCLVQNIIIALIQYNHKYKVTPSNNDLALVNCFTLWLISFSLFVSYLIPRGFCSVLADTCDGAHPGWNRRSGLLTPGPWKSHPAISSKTSSPELATWPVTRPEVWFCPDVWSCSSVLQPHLIMSNVHYPSVSWLAAG